MYILLSMISAGLFVYHLWEKYTWRLAMKFYGIHLQKHGVPPIEEDALLRMVSEYIQRIK